MIVKEKKYKHKSKEVTLKEDKKIRKITKKSVTEKFKVFDKDIEIKRPVFYLEAKDMFFEEKMSDG